MYIQHSGTDRVASKGPLNGRKVERREQIHQAKGLQRKYRESNSSIPKYEIHPLGVQKYRDVRERKGNEDENLPL